MNSTRAMLKISACSFVFLLGISAAHAASEAGGIVRQVLSEAIPTAFAPIELSTQDFAIDWENHASSSEGSDVRAELEPGSLEWVRVDDVLVLPRARLRVTIANAQSGIVKAAGVSQIMAPSPKPRSTSPESGGIRAIVPVALMGGDAPAVNPIEISWVDHGLRKSRIFHFRFQPQNRSSASRVAVDPSCSKFKLDTDFATASHDGEWAYIGCRRVVTQASQGRVNSLDVLIFWEGVSEVLASGVSADPVDASTWDFRMASAPGTLELSSAKSKILLTYQMPSRFHLGSLGFGVGPYSYQFNNGVNSASTVAPILTLYGSFILSESSRVVMFDAAALNSNGYNDLGLYFSNETVRALDQRLSVRLMIGGHLMAFNANSSTQLAPGFPQGFELSLGDVFRRGDTLSSGAFIYPNINGKEYNNIWLRWGGNYFGEINYISFLETPNGQRTYSRSLGLTFGFPLLGFY